MYLFLLFLTIFHPIQSMNLEINGKIQLGENWHQFYKSQQDPTSDKSEEIQDDASRTYTHRDFRSNIRDSIVKDIKFIAGTKLVQLFKNLNITNIVSNVKITDKDNKKHKSKSEEIITEEFTIGNNSTKKHKHHHEGTDKKHDKKDNLREKRDKESKHDKKTAKDSSNHHKKGHKKNKHDNNPNESATRNKKHHKKIKRDKGSHHDNNETDHKKSKRDKDHDNNHNKTSNHNNKDHKKNKHDKESHHDNNTHNITSNDNKKDHKKSKRERETHNDSNKPDKSPTENKREHKKRKRDKENNHNNDNPHENPTNNTKHKNILRNKENDHETNKKKHSRHKKHDKKHKRDRKNKHNNKEPDKVISIPDKPINIPDKNSTHDKQNPETTLRDNHVNLNLTESSSDNKTHIESKLNKEIHHDITSVKIPSDNILLNNKTFDDKSKTRSKTVNTDLVGKPINNEKYAKDVKAQNIDTKNQTNYKLSGPIRVKDDPQIVEHIQHLHAQSLKVINDLKSKTDNYKLKKDIDLVLKSYDEKFKEFVKENKYHRIKSRLGKKKVVLNAADTSNKILERLVRFVRSKVEASGLRSGVPNVFHNAIQRKIELENQRICKKFSICRSRRTYRHFLIDMFTIVLNSNNEKVQHFHDATTEVLKTRDFSKIMNSHTEKRFRDGIKSLEMYDLMTIRAGYFIIRNVLEKIHEPIKVTNKNSKSVNKTVAFIDLIDIFEEKIPPNEKNKLEWDDMLNSLRQWSRDERKDIVEIFQTIVDHVKKAIDSFDHATAKRAEKDLNIMMSR